MEQFRNLPISIARYNFETLADQEQIEFLKCLEDNAPIEHFNVKLLDYRLLVTFDADVCNARYCLYDNDTFDYNDYLFEASAESLDELARQIKRSLEVLIDAGFLTERCFWKWEKTRIGEDTLSKLLQYNN